MQARAQTVATALAAEFQGEQPPPKEEAAEEAKSTGSSGGEDRGAGTSAREEAEARRSDSGRETRSAAGGAGDRGEAGGAGGPRERGDAPGWRDILNVVAAEGGSGGSEPSGSGTRDRAQPSHRHPGPEVGRGRNGGSQSLEDRGQATKAAMSAAVPPKRTTAGLNSRDYERMVKEAGRRMDQSGYAKVSGVVTLAQLNNPAPGTELFGIYALKGVVAAHERLLKDPAGSVASHEKRIVQLESKSA